MPEPSGGGARRQSIVTAVPRFRLDFADDGTSIEIDADDFDDDGVEVSLYCYVPPGADPVAATTSKEVIASFERTSLAGPPQQVQ